MATVTVTGQVGTRRSKPGFLQPGGPSFAPGGQRALPSAYLPFIARLYSYGWGFKKHLGPLLNRPVIRSSRNGGQDTVTIDLKASDSTIVLGDLVTLTEQGGDGRVVYTGRVEQIPDVYQPAPSVSLVLAPLVTELGDTDFDRQYLAPTDVAQMVRDAIDRTQHLSYTTSSIPDTGVLGVYSFSKTNCLDVLNVARKIAGIQYWYFVDPKGLVWFQASGSTANYKVKQEVNFNYRKEASGLSGLRNVLTVVGGQLDQSGQPITSTYTGSSVTTYGRRVVQPPMAFPECNDQPTLDKIAGTLGAALDRIQHRVELTLMDYPTRIELGQPGGAILQFWEPTVNPYPEAAIANAGATYPVLDVTVDGPTQKVVIGDLPFVVDDLQYEVGRIIARAATQILTYQPALLNAMGTIGAGGIQSSALNPHWVLDALGFRAVDSSGVTRIEMGNLAANGISAQGYKIRVNDSGGTPVLDSDGLIGVAKAVASYTSNSWTSSTVGGSSSNAANTPTGLGGEVVLGTTSSFTTTRQTTFLILAVASGEFTVPPTDTRQPFYVRVTGLAAPDNNSPAGQFSSTGAGGPVIQSNATCFQVISLPGPATYTVDVLWNSTVPTSTLFVYSVNAEVFQLGG